MKKRIGWIGLAVVIAGAGYWGYARWRPTGADEAAPAYEIAEACRGNLAITLQTTAAVKPQNRLEIKAPLAGRIEEVLVQEGDMVKRGQILIWMSSTERAALLDAARARGEEELRRWSELYKSAPLLAPLDGQIIARRIEPGQTITAADVLLVMSDLLVLQAQVDETDLAQSRLGQEASITLDAYSDVLFAGRVSQIAYEAQTVDNVKVYNVELRPDAPPPFLRSGMTASIDFLIESRTNVLVVPSVALRDGPRGFAVLRPSLGNPNGEPERQRVTIGLNDGKNAEVLEGLMEGDDVLIPQIRNNAALDAPRNNPLMPGGRFTRSRRAPSQPRR